MVRASAGNAAKATTADGSSALRACAAMPAHKQGATTKASPHLRNARLSPVPEAPDAADPVQYTG